MALLSLSSLYILSLKMFSVDFVLLFTPFTVTGLSLLFLLNFVILIYNEFINSAEKGVKNGQIFQYG